VLQHALLRVLAVVGAVLLDLLCRRVQLVKLLLLRLLLLLLAVLLQALVQAAASIVPAGSSRNRQWR
jgi:hypothetical protein